MLRKYLVNGEEIDSLELKVLLITKGVNVSASEIYEQFAKTHRISQNPVECNCLILPGEIICGHPLAIGPTHQFLGVHYLLFIKSAKSLALLSKKSLTC